MTNLWEHDITPLPPKTYETWSGSEEKGIPMTEINSLVNVV